LTDPLKLLKPLQPMSLPPIPYFSYEPDKKQCGETVRALSLSVSLGEKLLNGKATLLELLALRNDLQTQHKRDSFEHYVSMLYLYFLEACWRVSSGTPMHKPSKERQAEVEQRKAMLLDKAVELLAGGESALILQDKLQKVLAHQELAVSHSQEGDKETEAEKKEVEESDTDAQTTPTQGGDYTYLQHERILDWLAEPDTKRGDRTVRKIAAVESQCQSTHPRRERQLAEP
jgi:hypothetical protein